ncbi:unnamed protein product [Rotaria sordida]|uniref:Uncharacterized protein n=1 Tax=Rotaria sordida TaxID=392033 RepID=A0A814WMN2_9BILA|nr:unnamed protein product [Rotaria sordida]
MTVDRPLPASQQPSACFSCHALGIASTSALGVYMFYQAKKANSSTHRFTCALFGLETDKIIDMKLFNEQMASLFRVLKRIDEIITNEHLITVKRDIEGFFIFASHRVSSLFKDISRQRIAAGGGLQRSLEERR